MRPELVHSPAVRDEMSRLIPALQTINGSRYVSLCCRHFLTPSGYQALRYNSEATHPVRLVRNMNEHGDLNNSHASRAAVELLADQIYSHQSLAIQANKDDADIRARYRPFLLPDQLTAEDWVAQLELSTGLKMVQTEVLDKKLDRLRILILYGSLRNRYRQSTLTW